MTATLSISTQILNSRDCENGLPAKEKPTYLLQSFYFTLFVLFCLLLIHLFQPSLLLAQVPVIESPKEKEVVFQKYQMFATVSHSPGAELEFRFTHAPLPSLNAFPRVFSPANIVPEQWREGDMHTKLLFTFSNEMEGDLRMKVKEKNSSIWSTARTVRLIPTGRHGVAKLETRFDYNQNKIIILTGRYLNFYANEGDSTRIIFENADGTFHSHRNLTNLPNNVDTVNDIYIGYYLYTIPIKGKVGFKINSLESNKVDYEITKFSDINLLSFNNAQNLKEGDSVNTLSLNVKNSGELATSTDTYAVIKCKELANNNPNQEVDCPGALSFIKFPIRQLGSGETILTYGESSPSRWKVGKYLLSATIGSNYPDKEKNLLNNKLQVVVDVLPKDSEREHSPNMLQIVSPRRNQVESGNVVLEILNSSTINYPIQLRWSHIEESQPGQWPQPPTDMNVITQTTDYRTVIPFTAFPRVGKWRITAFLKDPSTGSIAIDPVTNELLTDTSVFNLKGVTNYHLKDTSIKLTKKKTIQNTSHSHPLSFSILLPKQNQAYKINQRVPISLRLRGNQKVVWQVEKKEFGKKRFSPQRTELIKISKANTKSVVRKATLAASTSGYYRFRFKMSGVTTWSEWRNIVIGSPTLYKKVHQVTKIKSTHPSTRMQKEVVPAASKQPLNSVTPRQEVKSKQGLRFNPHAMQKAN